MTVQTAPKSLLPTLRRPPTDIFAPVQREFSRVLEDLGAGWSAIANLDYAPRMDVVETKTAVELTLELPGMTRDDVKLDIEDDVLTISGEKKVEKEVRDDAYRHSERTYGAFRRIVTLPRSVDPEKIQASMADGVLKVIAPKNGQSAAKHIPIQSGS